MPPLSELKLLIVDDDDFAVELFLCALEELGISNCETAFSGKQALEKVHNTPGTEAFDLVICDIEMPDMDGLELLRHLALAKFNGKVAVISGLDSEILRMAQDLGKAHSLDVIGAVQKPIQKQALETLLTKVDGNKQMFAKGPATQRAISIKDIEEGIANDEFTLFFQPKINVKTQQVYGAEALIRWFSNKYQSMVGPDEFIPLAEASKLINQITDIVISKSIQEIRRLKTCGQPLKMSINVSMVNLSELDFASNLSKKLQAESVEPGDIMLEITETALVSEATSVLEVLTRLKMLGISLSIDDFGTGYSSMSQLQNIPFSELKIDRSFVFGAGENHSTRQILESSASLARHLQIASVAEGVETREDWDRVASLGVDLVQGYFISRPLSSEDFQRWLTDWKGLPD